MKKFLIYFIVFQTISLYLSGQPLTGTKNIPGDYPTISNAISSLNTNGVGPGGVIFNIAADLKEVFNSADAGHITTYTGSASNPITFRKYGNGKNPLITAGTGTGNQDAIFRVAGCDYVTFDGMDIQERSENQDPESQMEWGFAILKESGTNGSQNITIKNCTITLNFYNPAATGIYSNNHTPDSFSQLVVTSESGGNSNLKVFGNTIENCYNGIWLNGYSGSSFFDQNNEIGKDGANLITHIGGLEVNAYGVYANNQSNLKVANTTVTSAMEGEGDVYGIYMTGAQNANFDLYGNTVSIQYTAWEVYNSDLYGIYCNMGQNGTSNACNIYNNIVTNCAFPMMELSVFYGIFVYGMGVTANVYGNTVSNNTIGSSSAIANGNIRYFWIQKLSTSAGPLIVHHNSVTGNSRLQAITGTSTTLLLTIAGNGTTLDAYNNTVSGNLISSSGQTNCLYVTFDDQSGKNIHDNVVSNITEANGSTAGLYNSGGTTGHIYNNLITGIYANPAMTTAYISGLNHSSGTTMYYYNNMISDLHNVGANGTQGYDYNMLSGIYVESGGTVKGFYNNTVYLDCPGYKSNYGSSAFCAASLQGIDLRNNIFINMSTSTPTNGKTVAIKSRSTSTSSFTSNYNDLYAGIPGESNLLFFNGTTACQTLQQYQAVVSTNETQSVTELPPFVNVNTAPYDVHLKTDVPTVCESGGSIMEFPLAIPYDLDGHARYPNPGYPVNPAHNPTAPDIGADEFGGLTIDKTPPGISYAPLTDINHGNARTLEVTITDASGVPVSGFGLPVLYWRRNGTGYIAVQGVSLGGGIYEFTFGGGSVLNDVVDYYIVAQDNVAPVPNVAASPSQGASGYSVNPPSCTTPPGNPSSYKVILEISGIRHIGVGKDYTTIKAAVNDLNTKYMSGPVTFVLDDNTYPDETFPIKFNNRPGNSNVNTLTIKPNTDANPVISGGSVSQSILVMNGLDYVTIDGSNNGSDSQNLTIQNLSYTPDANVIGISNNNGTDPSKFITIKNCNLLGSKSWNLYIDTYVILVNQSGGLNGGGYDYLVIRNNTMRKAKIAMLILASLNNRNRNITIQDNIIGSSDTNYYIQRYGIAVGMSDNTLIKNNDIIGPGSGSMFENMFGIMYWDNCSNTKIHNNKIHDWFTLGLGSVGIKCGNDNDATITEIYNNQIYNIRAVGMNSGVSNNNAYGIFVRWGGNIQIWHNTIQLSGPYLFGSDYGSTSSACLCFYEQSTNNFDIRNNIFRNSMTNSSYPPNGTGGLGRAYGIQFTGDVSKFSVLDNNDYYIDGFQGTIAQHWITGVGPAAELETMAQWQAYSGKEEHGLNVNPQFISQTDPIDLHPQNLNLNNTGSAKILDTDYSGDLRYDPSDMGAYEWSALINNYHTLAATEVTGLSAKLNGDINTNGEYVEVFFDYGTTGDYGNTISPAPSTIRCVDTLMPVSVVVSGLLPGTTYHYRFWGIPKTSGQANIYGTDMTFTTPSGIPENITVTDTVAGTECFNATNTITVAGNGTGWVVTNGGSATLIAGQKILFLPGAKVLPGGYMHAYITTNGEYCQPLKASMASVLSSGIDHQNNPDMMSDQTSLRVFPNPAGEFINLELNGEVSGIFPEAQFWSMKGVLVKSEKLAGENRQPISVSDLQSGVYFIRVNTQNTVFTVRMVKL